MSLSLKLCHKILYGISLVVPAVGFALSFGYPSPSFNSMIVQAESKMYRDKADHYKQHDRIARR